MIYIALSKPSEYIMECSLFAVLCDRLETDHITQFKANFCLHQWQNPSLLCVSLPFFTSNPPSFFYLSYSSSFVKSGPSLLPSSVVRPTLILLLHLRKSAHDSCWAQSTMTPAKTSCLDFASANGSAHSSVPIYSFLKTVACLQRWNLRQSLPFQQPSAALGGP